MDETVYEKLFDIVNQLSSMSFILKAYCEKYEEDVKEIGYLVEFAKIMHETVREIYKLF